MIRSTPSRDRFRIFTILTILVVAASAALGQLAAPEKASLTLRADRTAYLPGEPVRIAAVVDIEDGWHMNSHTPTFDWLIPTELSLTLPEATSVPDATYPPAELLRFAFSDALSEDNAPIAVYAHRAIIVVSFTLPETLDGSQLEVPASLYYQACDDSSCLPPVTTHAQVELTLGSGGEPANREIFDAAQAAASRAAASDASEMDSFDASSSGASLLAILALGVLGGLILNAMPCVLPVLSLKVFGIVHSADRGRKHLVAGSLATAAGILLSFWALAAVAVAARAGGNAIGWGVQFQQPGFVAFLAVVVVLFSLNMWGLFEIPLPTLLSRVGGGGGEGLAGHFASGLFATLMATPCSAPFLGTAVGFALGQPASTIFAVFTAVGLGLSLPYLLLAVFPGLARALPKPGQWMVTLRGVLGFLLAAAAVWLFFVLAGEVGSVRVAMVQLALLALTLFVWLHQRLGPAGRRVAWAATAAAALATIMLAASAPPRSAAEGHTSSHHEWLAFDEQEARSLAADGHLVFVDVTADWCLTCKTNEWGVIETDEIDQAFDRYGVVTMRADWTNRNDAIAAYLAKFGRSSIPFYVLYRPGQPPHVFSELLTKSRVLDALKGSSAALAALRERGRE